MTFGTVLVIDDEKDLLNLVRYNLERADFKVLESTEGRTGLEIAERVRPDAIVLDWMMPAADGIEVCRRLRADPNTSEIPVLMLTARAEEADRIKGLESGADDYLVKPFSPRELIARLRALLRRRRAERRGDLTIDVVRGRVEFRGAPIPVTPSEFRVLQLLATSPVKAVVRSPARAPRRLFGELAVRQKFITRAQVAAALDVQERGSGLPLGQILSERGMLHAGQVEYLLGIQRESPGDDLLGQILLSKSMAVGWQIHGALRLQGLLTDMGLDPVPRLGEILIKRGALSLDAIETALGVQAVMRLGCPECGGNLAPSSQTCSSCGHSLSALYGRVAFAVQSALDDEASRHRVDLPDEVLAACLDRENDFGGYLLLKEIGRGGMGIVYRAWKKDVHRIVALKVLTHHSLTGSGVPTPFGDSEDVKRFHREATAISQLNHPFIVRILDFGVCRNQFFFTMPLIEGKRLDSIIEGAADSTPLKAAYGLSGFALHAALVRDLARAVASAHERGILHLDLKPGNVLIDDLGKPTIIDFGVARLPNAETEPSSMVIGTPHYMAPELISGVEGGSGTAADVYSLGAILYELLCGSSPYAGVPSAQVPDVIAKEAPMPVERLAPGAPKELVAIVHRAMARDPRQRPVSAESLAVSLDLYLQDQNLTNS